MTMFEDPNREAVGVAPIWGGPLRDNDPNTPPAGEDPDDGELPGEPGAFTVAEVRSWVDDHPHLAADVLAHERARGAAARSTLVEWLEGFVESHDGDDAP